MASELESDLQDTIDWSRKWLVDFNVGKTQVVSFDQSSNTGAIARWPFSGKTWKKVYLKFLTGKRGETAKFSKKPGNC